MFPLPVLPRVPGVAGPQHGGHGGRGHWPSTLGRGLRPEGELEPAGCRVGVLATDTATATGPPRGTSTHGSRPRDVVSCSSGPCGWGAWIAGLPRPQIGPPGPQAFEVAASFGIIDGLVSARPVRFSFPLSCPLLREAGRSELAGGRGAVVAC